MIIDCCEPITLGTLTGAKFLGSGSERDISWMGQNTSERLRSHCEFPVICMLVSTKDYLT